MQPLNHVMHNPFIALTALSDKIIFISKKMLLMVVV